MAILHAFSRNKNGISNHSVITVENHLYTMFGKKKILKTKNVLLILKKINCFCLCMFIHVLIFFKEIESKCALPRTSHNS